MMISNAVHAIPEDWVVQIVYKPNTMALQGEVKPAVMLLLLLLLLLLTRWISFYQDKKKTTHNRYSVLLS